MDVGYAQVTARVVGPDGTPRTGRVTFQPLYDAWSLVIGEEKAAVIGRTTARLDDEGRLALPSRRLSLAAPTSMPADLNNYLLVLDTPGDPEAPRRYRVRLTAGMSVDVTDLISGANPTPAPPPGPQPPPGPLPGPGPQTPPVHDAGNGLLTGSDIDIVDLGNGLLTWRKNG